MNQAIQTSRIMTGDWVGSAWGSSPEWTPYAQGIADHYSIQVPWYLTKQVTFTGSATRFTQTTRPYLYDVLILGASALVEDNGSSGQQLNWLFTYLNITHQESGIPWATPNKIGLFPIPAIAGIASFTGVVTPFLSPTSIVRLPEAFFLPANTTLKLDWEVISNNSLGTFDASITLIGVQLINHATGFKRPETVRMPDGSEVRIGSRLPWFSTLPVGEYQSRSIGNFQLAAGRQVAQYFPPQECDVEIHDAYSNFITTGGTIAAAQIQTKITDMGAQKFWTPNPTPMTAVFGGDTQVYPAMPFTKPYLLPSGNRIKTTLQNNANSGQILARTITLRGVRRCQF